MDNPCSELENLVTEVLIVETILYQRMSVLFIKEGLSLSGIINGLQNHYYYSVLCSDDVTLHVFDRENLGNAICTLEIQKSAIHKLYTKGHKFNE